MKNVIRFNEKVALPNIPFLTDEEGEFERTITPKPRVGILTKNISIDEYVSFLGNEDDWKLIIKESSGVGEREVYSMPYCYFVKPLINNFLDSYQDTLAYDLPDEIGISGITLKDKYLSQQERVISNMKYLKVYVHLDEVDIANLDFSIPVYISSKKAYFYISKITNYRGSKETTLCELVKIG